jgi:hypothetical protein
MSYINALIARHCTDMHRQVALVGQRAWEKVNRPMIESVCAENNLNYETFFKLKEYPMPEAKTPDF